MRSGVVEVQDAIRKRMGAGTSLDEVETELIDPSDLTEDEKAALWLYAWSFLGGERQRYEAMQHLRRLELETVEIG